MKLFMPTKVYMEDYCVPSHSAELASFGTKACIVTGAHSSRENGSLRDVENALEHHHVPYIVFDQVESNPSIETVAKGAIEALSHGCDFFIGVGGGSPMDAAKGIAVLAKNPQFIETAEVSLYTEGNLEAYPVVCVPTTCGTGSEVTQYAVLTRHNLQTKKSIATKFFPKLALVDSRYLMNASYDTLKCTCVDALAHLIESYLSTNADSLNRMYAQEGLRQWGRVKEALWVKEAFHQISKPTYDAFMQASVIAGMAIAQTGTSLPHALSYPVTYTMGVPHGSAVALFLPGYLETYEFPDDAKKVLELLGFETFAQFRTYIRQVIGNIAIEDDLFNEAISSLLTDASKCANHPFEVEEDDLLSYLRYDAETERYVL
ncbi:MAG: iron-containing alcohol dehydrogenase family protein [Anaerotardibacter sp.]